ncbi:MAG: flagellar export chaperone FliS [Lachnospiraceae bacterium]|nr:flagellar export chaperone FliS [Lachnospiraceae bacterium]
MTREKKQELTLRITQANKTELIEILYEMVLCYVDDAVKAHENGDRAEYRDSIRKTRGCINELLSSLNLDYNLAMNFLQLYLYCNRELALADVKNDCEHLEHVHRVVGKLQEAYVELAKQDTSGPVMQNSQTVYAGLTYGRGELTENMADQGMNRGFRA